MDVPWYLCSFLQHAIYHAYQPQTISLHCAYVSGIQSLHALKRELNLNNFLLFIFIIVIFAENASFTRKLWRHLLALMALTIYS